MDIALGAFAWGSPGVLKVPQTQISTYGPRLPTTAAAFSLSLSKYRGATSVRRIPVLLLLMQRSQNVDFRLIFALKLLLKWSATMIVPNTLET